jgi:F-type H+-transporting ATPase subunit b
MPQLDPSSFASQLFWLTVTFVMLYLILARFVLPRIHAVLESRKSRLDSDLGTAARLKEEAEAAKASYEKSLHDAKEKSASMITAAQQVIAQESTQQQQALDKELTKKMADAEASIATSRKTALDHLIPMTSELTSTIVESLVRHRPDTKQIEQLVGDLAKQKGLS